MVDVASGYYAPITAKRVTHWPAPDADGDGEEVWEDQVDGAGNIVGRMQAKDDQGRPLHRYEAPEGFRNIASREAGSDGVTDNWVLMDGRGRVKRHPNTGEAIGIRPGTTLVEDANGDFRLLTDDYSRYLFLQSHTPTDTPPASDVQKPKTAAERKQDEVDAAQQELEDLRAFKANADATAKKSEQGKTAPVKAKE